MPPGVGERAPDARKERESSSDEDSPPSAQPPIQGIRKPTAKYSSAQVGSSVDKPFQPAVTLSP